MTLTDVLLLAAAFMMLAAGALLMRAEHLHHQARQLLSDAAHRTAMADQASAHAQAHAEALHEVIRTDQQVWIDTPPGSVGGPARQP